MAGDVDNDYDLEDRLLEVAVRLIRVAEALPRSAAGTHIRNQLIRSGTSPAPNYGEAQGAESRADFIHKLRIVLKELRESRVWLRMIVRAGLIKPGHKLDPVLAEVEELVAIFATAVKTAKRNKDKS
jgi:four helix bundle protein